MKIAVFGNFGVRNLGDDLILEGFLQQHAGHEITVFCGNPDQVTSQFQLPAQHFFPGGIRSMLKYWFNSHYRAQIKTSQQVLKSCDKIFIGGGGILVDHHLKALYLWRAQLAEIKKSKVPYHFIANSLELRTNKSQKLFKPFLQSARSITVRDKASQSLLSSMGISSQLVADLALSADLSQTPSHFKGEAHIAPSSNTNVPTPSPQDPNAEDTCPVGLLDHPQLGFEINPPHPPQSPDLRNFSVVGSPILPNPPPPSSSISLALNRWLLDTTSLQIIRKFIQKKQTEGYQVQALAFQTVGDDDRTVYQQLALDIPVLTGKAAVLSAIQSSDLIIAMRFHAILLALHFHIPVIALPYQHKVTALMTDHGLAAHLIPLSDLNQQKLQDLFQKLVEDKALGH